MNTTARQILLHYVATVQKDVRQVSLKFIRHINTLCKVQNRIRLMDDNFCIFRFYQQIKCFVIETNITGSGQIIFKWSRMWTASYQRTAATEFIIHTIGTAPKTIVQSYQFVKVVTPNMSV